MLRRALFVSAAALVLAHSPAPAQPPAQPPAAQPAPAFTPDITLPDVLLTRDNLRITRSCRVIVPEGFIIPDADGDGVLQILADNITVEFAQGSVLRGATVGDAPGLTPWDALTGVGVRVENAKNVTLRGLRVEGFKIAILARNADGLTVEHADLRDNFRQRLGSTPQGEDSRDWLWPHANDSREWATRYGAALLVERSRDVTIRRVTVRRGQNGIMLDRVSHASIYDNDASFLSGWGLAMWRSSDNLVSRNAFDFCVRGHSEGVYNRGQDSAGILAFEQCSRNHFLENSVTHGGDGFFGFAGKEALGETPPPSPDFNYADAGCNDNEFRANDFSYAPAHGLELTFSKRNIVRANLFIENAICGIWGGYSSHFVIIDNHFENNGGMAYGLENGAINIEHGSHNLIAVNDFINNRTAVHLWWDNDAALLERPGVKASYQGVTSNTITGNTIDLTPAHPFPPVAAQPPRLTVLRLRDTPADSGPHVRDTYFSNNTITLTAPNAVEIDATKGIEPITEFIQAREEFDLPPITREPVGDTRPVGARAHLAGRRNIIMGPWGPWDHDEPMVRLARTEGATRTYEFFAARTGPDPRAEDLLDNDSVIRWAVQPTPEKPLTFTISSPSGVKPYAFRFHDALGWSADVRGTIVGATWDARFFSWDDATDPRTNLDAWRARAAEGVPVRLPNLTLRYANAGPRAQPWAKSLPPDLAGALPANDRFAMIARTRIHLPAGDWRFSTLSDDGVRVLVNNRPILENWTWHAPTRDTALFHQPEDAEVEIVVEHFEIDGYSVLEFEIAPAE